MSIRRVNSTGRKRILRQDARVFVQAESEGVLVFDAKINLSEYELPGEAQVFLEAYRQTTFMRFDFGTVVAPIARCRDTCRLTEFNGKDGILFRVKVTSMIGRQGVLLAEADHIPLSDFEEAPDRRVPLLPIAPDESGQEVWRVDLSPAAGPLLLVSTKVGDWKSVAATPTFRSLVFPAAMRQVLWHIYKVEEIRDSEDLSDWRCRWLAFASSLPGSRDQPSTSEDEDWETWISSAVEAFARKHQFIATFKGELQRLGEVVQ